MPQAGLPGIADALHDLRSDLDRRGVGLHVMAHVKDQRTTFTIQERRHRRSATLTVDAMFAPPAAVQAAVAALVELLRAGAVSEGTEQPRRRPGR